MALVIRMQGYKDWKVGLITTEELLAGKVYAEPPALRKMWEHIVARAKGDWSKVAHHVHCCCNKCAPTEEDRKRKVELHSVYHETLEKAHDIACCCNECLDAMEQGLYTSMDDMFENLVPSKSKVVSVLDCNHKGDTNCELCYAGLRGPESLAPSDCEE